MEKLKILVCTHKKYEGTRNDGAYQAIQVGKALHKDLDLGFLTDDDGDSISEKNPLYSEWTAIYWAWKNLKNVEYVGICHYRRYFSININENNIEQILRGKDILVVKGKERVFKNERFKNLCAVTSREDAYIFLDSFLTIHPEYKKELVEYYFNDRTSYPFSMFVTKKEIFEDYCKFIFPVLSHVEKRAKGHGYSRQNRFIGYFGESSLGLYIRCKGLKVATCGYTMPGMNEQRAKITFPQVLYNCHRALLKMLDTVEPAATQIWVDDAVRVGLKNDGIELPML